MSDIDTSTENSEDIADACAHFIDEESAAVVRALAAERDVLAARCAALEQMREGYIVAFANCTCSALSTPSEEQLLQPLTLTYAPDVVELGNGLLRVVWSSTSSEEPTALRLHLAEEDDQ